MGQLTTHILDTANGKPAANVNIRLFGLGAARSLLSSAVSNSDGRSAAPLLAGEALRAGEYELEFDIGPYFAALGGTAAHSQDAPASEAASSCAPQERMSDGGPCPPN
jgi:5-hydroxyisourate hydrolase-like protein (transthyretin family)